MGESLRVGFIGAGLIATFHSKMLRAAVGKVERAGEPASPDFRTAVDARRVVDAIYRSAYGDGASVEP